MTDDRVLPRPFRHGEAGLADPFNLSDEALRWRQIRMAPAAWNRRPMFEVLDDHGEGCDCPRFDEDADWDGATTAARWPKPFRKDTTTYEGIEL